MKKTILYCSVYLSGFLGAIGWIIACAAKTAGGSSAVLGCITNGTDWIIITILCSISLIGFLKATSEIRNTNQ